ncbi:hypothetical protein, partial [Klebsiella pneumoniae]|uniref:hypothetical protein n=1 Tax=Klebsiella pneumoniae TaxID=573 RepID=UPI00273A105A
SLAFTVVVELNPATYFAGSCPASCASSSSVSGVMLAVAVLPIDPEPATSECSTVLPSLLVAVTTQGRLAPVMGAEELPSALVVAVPEPAEQVTLTVAPGKAAPVAATPLIVCDCCVVS